MIKAVFFDIDGTLVSHRTKCVPQSALKAIDLLRAKGIKVGIASGRNPVDYKMLPVGKLSFDFYVMFNGQGCYDKDWNIICDAPLKDKPIIDQMFIEKKYSIGCVEEDRIFINFPNEFAKKAFSDVSTPVTPIGLPSDKPIYQASFYIDASHDEEIAAQLTNSRLVRWNKGATDVIACDGGKAVGIKHLLEKEGLVPDEIICFGDAANDLDMIEMAGIGVAMGNAIDELKAIADYTTTDIDDNGIYNALSHFTLI